MPKFGIERNGIPVNQIVFIGNQHKILFRESDIIPLTFDNENKALEIASIWENAKVIELAA